MPALAALALAILAFAVVLRFWLFVDLEDGILLGCVFCAVAWIVLHFATS